MWQFLSDRRELLGSSGNDQTLQYQSEELYWAGGTRELPCLLLCFGYPTLTNSLCFYSYSSANFQVITPPFRQSGRMREMIQTTMTFLILHLDMTVNFKIYCVWEKKKPNTVKRKWSACASGEINSQWGKTVSWGKAVSRINEVRIADERPAEL